MPIAVAMGGSSSRAPSVCPSCDRSPIHCGPRRHRRARNPVLERGEGRDPRHADRGVPHKGGFPELYEKPELDAAAFYRSYVTTYLERDLRQLLQVNSLRDFERFIRACALRSAQLLNRTDSRATSVSPVPRRLAWLAVLDASGQVALLEPWFGSRAKSLVKAPKLYLRDSGLCSFLVGIRREADLAASPLAGALWETLVFGEIRRLQVNAGGG